MNKVISQSAPAPATTPGQGLYEHAKTLIPGGVQLLSKRPEMFAPGQWPVYYRQASGCRVIDSDGREFIDMSMMGVGSCLLGYTDPDVTEAVVQRIRSGSMCTLNCPEDIELADLLLDIHPWADHVRYARTGGEAMAMAVRIARASNKRDIVAFCGYHGWHDWYLAANLSPGGHCDKLNGHLLPGLSPLGVPSQLSGTILPFGYNKIDELAGIVKRHGRNLAAVVMEPTRSIDPEPGFLGSVQELCESSGAKLIIDEITTGWRLHYGGAHLRYGLTPDIAVFAKALSNGHPMAAIVGRSEVMQSAQESFISSTYWTEGVGPVAALATVRKMGRIDVPGHTDRIGKLFRAGLTTIAKQAGVPLLIGGHPAITTIAFAHPENLALQTLLTVRMLEQGILAGSAFYATMAHEQEHLDAYLGAAQPIFDELAESIRVGDVLRRIGGPVRHAGFARLA